MLSAPGSMTAAVLILALGTGANTAVLATTYGVLLRPLPYSDASRLVIVSTMTADGTETSLPRKNIDALTRGLTTVERAAGYADRELTVQTAAESRLMRVTEVTPGFFDVLGVAPSVGRASFDEGSGPEVVVSARLERDLRRAADNVLGRPLPIATSVHTVSGVMPARFGFPAYEVDAWTYMPVAPPPPTNPVGRPIEWPRFRLLARLAPGVTLEMLRDDVTRVMRELYGPTFGHPGGASASVRVVEQALTGSVRPALLAAIAASVLVLLVACANVAVLLLGVQAKRAREWAMRLALGASMRRLVQATFVESALLATLGSVLGVGVAMALVGVFLGAAAGHLPRLHEVSLDMPVLVGAVVISAIVAIVCGMAPALALTRRDLLAVFRGATTSSSATHRLRSALIIAQLALSFVLVTGTGLLARTVMRLAEEDAGITPTGALAARLVLNDDILTDVTTRAPMLRALLDRVRALPGVEHAGVGGNLPPTILPTRIFVTFVERKETMPLSLASATPEYLEALGVRLVTGRLFDADDEGRPDPVVVVSESAARFLAPGKDLTGQELPIRLPPIVGFPRNPRVLGIVRDVKYSGLDAPAPATVYVQWRDLPSGTSYLVVRGPLDAERLAPAIRQALRDVDPTIPVPLIRSIDDQMAMSIANRRMRLIPAAGFAGLALAVSLVGLAATLSRAVQERRRELAIRTAVGASPARLTRMVLGEGLRLAIIGLVVGLLLARASASGLAHLLYGVSPYDPLTFATVTALLIAAALGASLIPARRAAKAQPLELLRAE